MPHYQLLYIIQVKEFSWPYLISKVLVAYNYSYNAASDWPHTFFSFYLAYQLPITKINLEVR